MIRPKPKESPKPSARLYCSFCGKREDEVFQLIAGPTVFICSECIELCSDIITERREKTASEKRPILCVDFDGVANPYTRGWQDGELYETETTPGFFDWAADVKSHFRLTIYSSRSKTPAGRDAMRQWMMERLTEWRDIWEDNNNGDTPPLSLTDFEFVAEKPPAWLTIDDRCIRFEGDWTRSELKPEALLAFQPWNKR